MLRQARRLCKPPARPGAGCCYNPATQEQSVRMPLSSSDAGRLVLASALCALLAGCASARDPRDPLEPLNRGVYQVNEALDKALLKPVARGYKAAVPPPVRGGVTNFFGNFNDVTTAINDALQGKLRDAATDVGRIAVNSTIGILGVFDVATRLGLEKHDEDFGQTFGVWGVRDGPYLVLPLLGPSTFRDTVGLGAQYFTDPEFFLFTHGPESYVVFGIRAVNVRASLLDAERILDAAAIDKYAFLRDAYLQRRRNLIHDGNPPPEPGSVKTAPHRKTLKEMEMEEDLDNGGGAPPEPGSPVNQQQ